MIKPEDLKAVAEWMGYVLFSNDNPKLTDRVVVWDGEQIHTRQLYSPLTNPEQLLELIEKLKIDIYWDEESEIWVAEKTKGEVPTIGYERETLPEAVIKAVLEMIGD